MELPGSPSLKECGGKRCYFLNIPIAQGFVLRNFRIYIGGICCCFWYAVVVVVLHAVVAGVLLLSVAEDHSIHMHIFKNMYTWRCIFIVEDLIKCELQ
ncbi:hypothetical protein RIF29_15074 [Crotalaria pallida]|uniref:Uncharacterized protein n=1 Tax=Crotalaria pallida TaxID=3830 RepID=A0AAN9FIC3_CROPI